MGQLIGPDGKPPARIVHCCGRCLEELVRTEHGATICPNGCPP